jgi:hypothetical protein
MKIYELWLPPLDKVCRLWDLREEPLVRYIIEDRTLYPGIENHFDGILVKGEVGAWRVKNFDLILSSYGFKEKNIWFPAPYCVISGMLTSMDIKDVEWDGVYLSNELRDKQARTNLFTPQCFYYGGTITFCHKGKGYFSSGKTFPFPVGQYERELLTRYEQTVGLKEDLARAVHQKALAKVLAILHALPPMGGFLGGIHFHQAQRRFHGKP